MNATTNTENTDFAATYEINEGIDGSARPVFQVCAQWTDRNWNKRSRCTYFKSREAAQNFIDWS